MSGESTEGIGEVLGEEFSAKLREVSFHGDTRDCAKPHSIEKRNRSRQSQSRVDFQLTYPLVCKRYTVVLRSCRIL